MVSTGGSFAYHQMFGNIWRHIAKCVGDIWSFGCHIWVRSRGWKSCVPLASSQQKSKLLLSILWGTEWPARKKNLVHNVNDETIEKTWFTYSVKFKGCKKNLHNEIRVSLCTIHNVQKVIL